MEIFLEDKSIGNKYFLKVDVLKESYKLFLT